MLVFKEYEHFKKYCFKIFYNKEVSIGNWGFSTFKRFEPIPEFIQKLAKSNIVTVFNNKDEGLPLLNKIISYFKGDEFENTLKAMRTVSYKYESVMNGELNIFYFIDAIKKHLKIEIAFNKEFINEENINHEYFPSVLNVLEIKEGSKTFYPIKATTDLYERDDLMGVYFIYDNQGELGYIGKSTSNLIQRSIRSTSEKNLGDFTKIEIILIENASDCAIYEVYYITKYKPYKNDFFIHEDCPTLKLPELEKEMIFERELERDFFLFEFSYIEACVVDTKTVLQYLNGSIFFEDQKNISRLNQLGYYDKKTTVYNEQKKIMNNLGRQGYITISDLRGI